MSFFKLNANYDTSYGLAQCTEEDTWESDRAWGIGRTAQFVLYKPTVEARKDGWKEGMLFSAHPDDQTVPSPRKWKVIS